MMKTDRVYMEIPAKPEYMICLRLTASCVAERFGFDIAEIEDIKTAVAEAGIQLLPFSGNGKIAAEFYRQNGISIDVSTAAKEEEVIPSPEAEIGAFILEAMVDSCELTVTDEVRTYHLMKLQKEY